MDIVERMRSAAWAGPVPCPVCDEAADEITRLRADAKEVAAARGFLRERDGLLRELAGVRDENAKLRADVDECDALRTKLADILTRTANALKGQPAPLQLHSWHDLPECAQGLREDAERLDFLDGNSRFNMGWFVGAAPAGNLRVSSVVQLGKPATSIREAIDAARKGE